MSMNQAGIYLRLSKEDGDTDESNSILNQRSLIEAFANSHDLPIIEEFVDDGYTGTNFNRPAFQRLMERIESKEINVVIVKDLSRFGRDYIETGRYIQRIFPALGIRFISINDHYDSFEADMNETHLILPIKNLINDSYCRDISMKVRSTQQSKRLNGEFIGAFAPFGYLKDSQKKNHLIIDESVKHIIQKIFELKLDGYSSKAIADFLNEIGEVTPLQHKKMQASTFNGGFQTYSYHWDVKMVNRILENRVYIGDLEQGKTRKFSYKSQKIQTISSEDWIKVEKTHEGIVSESVYLIANNLLKRDVRGTVQSENLYAGMLFCRDCHSQMVRRKVKYKDKEIITYICGNHKTNGACTRHSIKLGDLNHLISDILVKELKLQKKIIQQFKELDLNGVSLQIDFSDLISERNKIDSLLNTLHFDLDDGLIDEAEYQEFQKKYRLKIQMIDSQIEKKSKVSQNIYEVIQERLRWIHHFQCLSNSEILNRRLLVSLVDKIEIGEDKAINLVFHHMEELDLLHCLVKQEREVL